MLIILYPRLYNSLSTSGEVIIHVWRVCYPRLKMISKTYLIEKEEVTL